MPLHFKMKRHPAFWGEEARLERTGSAGLFAVHGFRIPFNGSLKWMFEIDLKSPLGLPTFGTEHFGLWIELCECLPSAKWREEAEAFHCVVDFFEVAVGEVGLGHVFRDVICNLFGFARENVNASAGGYFNPLMEKRIPI